MELPEKFPVEKLSVPYRLIYWSCKVSKNDFLGVFLIPGSLVAAGFMLYSSLGEIGSISKGLGFAMLWTAFIFAMLYFGQYRVIRILKDLKPIILPESDKQNLAAQTRAYEAINGKRHYLGGAGMLAITMLFLYGSFIDKQQSPWLWSWSLLFCAFSAFVGGYGMSCVLAFGGIIRDFVNGIEIEPDPYYPDLFMGLKPLGNLAVANALIASTGSLLFPIIFEAIRHYHSETASDFYMLLCYSAFIVIAAAIGFAFLWPLFVIKNKIESCKFKILREHDKNYRELLDAYKENPAAGNKDLLILLNVERTKLREIRVFPFESRMMLQVFVSIMLPVVMLLLEVYLKSK